MTPASRPAAAIRQSRGGTATVSYQAALALASAYAAIAFIAAGAVFIRRDVTA